MTRQITITPVLNGFVVHAGCQKLVFNSANELATNIQRYYENPNDVEQLFIKNAVNKTMDNPPLEPAPRLARSILEDIDRSRCNETVPNPAYESPAPTQSPG